MEFLLDAFPPHRYDFFWLSLVFETFNAFDKDGNGELGFPEYVEAWKFLNQPGSQEEIKAAFDSVDVDGSALIDLFEFLLSFMGDEALK